MIAASPLSPRTLDLTGPVPPPLLYDDAESDRCHDEWKASCGHHSIAAVCEVTLEDVRKAVTHTKGWMNPTNVAATLRTLGFPFTLTKGLKTKEPTTGINRIQFEGEWLNPGKPASVAYFYTHWVGMRNGCILDTVIDQSQWLPVNAWAGAIDAYASEGRYSGWHITHQYLIE